MCPSRGVYSGLHGAVVGSMAGPFQVDQIDAA